ncbi:hypothetical protein EJ08DRAFT_96843 [Tothia fuscella]|uniref:CFEM domain-containing protein n=1 Tax=Tothia fuscella TaxID=1048955 RepID=A0A9P4U197_9PEZI|nr:hypothetical protein EJ08DRAFT_96843 [Tothia fuscella]
MKYSIALLAGAVAMVSAQAGIDACGQTCINNMLAIGQSQFKCGPAEAACLCGNADFGNGLRDCTLQACGAAVYQQVLSYGTSFCATAGAQSSGAAVTALSSGLASVSSGLASATGAAGGVITSAISTSKFLRVLHLLNPHITNPSAGEILSVISSAGSAVNTLTGQTTLFTTINSVAASASGVASSLSGAASSLSGAASSAAASASSALGSASSAAGSAAGSATSAASSAAGGATSSSSAGFAPAMTAAPFLGGVALLGLAML